MQVGRNAVVYRRNIICLPASSARNPDCAVRAPHAEILIEPFRDEPKIDTLKRRFERDLDLPVLDLQLDQLQPNRALAYGYKAQRGQPTSASGVPSLSG
jgi:hypothetical protein